MRIALANLAFPASPADSVTSAQTAIRAAEAEQAEVICFPECYVPGYRAAGKGIPPPDINFLREAHQTIANTASTITVILGTERIVDGALRPTALVINAEPNTYQDKIQLDPSEDETYAPGTERHLFQRGDLKFGIAICHEGWRYPETVRWAARRGAHIVFHPHFHEAEPGSYQPETFAHPANTFHEKAALCRAAENTIYFATVNTASPGSPTTSAVINPDGTLHCHQPYGQPGILYADIDITKATGLLARRCKS